MAKDPYLAQVQAYYDGTLEETRRQALAGHLDTCPVCQNELARLSQLSQLLQTYPAASRRLSRERFTARVQQQIAVPPEPAWKRWLKAAWRWAPLPLFLTWAALQAALIVGALSIHWFWQFEGFSTAGGGDLGVLLLALSGVSGWPLAWGLIAGLQYELLLNCALLFAGWIAVEWLRRKRQPLNQFQVSLETGE